MQEKGLETVFLRLSLAAGFLSAIADRFGIWGAHDETNVAWGDMAHFLHYTAKLNPLVPSTWIPAVGWIVTISETTLGIFLIIGWQTRWASRLSGVLLLLFGLGMALGPGVKTALDASVFAASGGAFLLAASRKYPWTVDEALASQYKSASSG